MVKTKFDLRRFVAAVLAAVCLASFAVAEEEDDEFAQEFATAAEVFDPLGGYNRVMTQFNDKLMRGVLVPVATSYAKVVTPPYQEAIGSFFHNLAFPFRFANNLLQLKFKEAGVESARFLINSVLGFAGVSDVAAKHYGLSAKPEDLGQTLGYWGVGGGFHIVLPLLGPSNLRDFTAFVGEFYANPLGYMDEWMGLSRGQSLVASGGRFSLQTLNMISQNPAAYELLTKDAVELYPFLRDAYEAKRKFEIDN